MSGGTSRCLSTKEKTVNILEILTAGQGGQIVGNLAQSFGLDRKQAASVLSAVVPELTRNMERQSFNRGGIADLVSALGKADYEKALAPNAPLTSPGITDAGIEVLDTVLWSKDRSRSVAHRAARDTGVDENVIKQMLPAIAAILMGGIDSKARGALETIGSEVGVPVAKAADLDVGDQRPLPVPGDRPRSIGRANNPYGDLSDIIRRGGKSLPGGIEAPRAPSGGNGGRVTLPPSGGSLDTIIRDVLGGIAGFQSKGVLGWIIRYFLVRWGWNFIQSILRRLFTGR
ncbi:MAG: hypothetical protein C0519_11485 [Hyphomicrobium sp.]|nr:hypothetical protein [Hyphomicrobium sp.]PPD06391.1 MAG: hypothetical protein CTY28_14115 [Hyphomicrobium sp.]